MLLNNRPAIVEAANCHASSGPRRSEAARAATPIASTPSPTPLPVAGIAPSNGSKSWASTVNNARTPSATTAKRRSQPRTVANGTPATRAAVRAMLNPFARAVNATPITPTASRRRSSESAGNST